MDRYTLSVQSYIQLLSLCVICHELGRNDQCHDLFVVANGIWSAENVSIIIRADQIPKSCMESYDCACDTCCSDAILIKNTGMTIAARTHVYLLRLTIEMASNKSYAG